MTCDQEQQMGKVQKNFMLDEEYDKLLTARQRITGATITRLLKAALLSYFFSDPEGPNRIWMEHVIDLEEGDVDFSSILSELCMEAVQRETGCLDSTIGPNGEVTEIPESAGIVYGRWQKLIKATGDDPIKKIIDHWNKENS